VLSALAAVVDKKAVRIGLVLLGVLSTIALAPAALFAAYATVVSIVEGRGPPWWGGIAGLGGIIGFLGAWSRVLFSSTRFRSSLLLRMSTSLALVVGVLAAGILFFSVAGGPDNPAAWLFVGLAVLGLILLGATLGTTAHAT
jgi:hypothetical protein